MKLLNEAKFIKKKKKKLNLNIIDKLLFHQMLKIMKL